MGCRKEGESEREGNRLESKWWGRKKVGKWNPIKNRRVVREEQKEKRREREKEEKVKKKMERKTIWVTTTGEQEGEEK